MNNFATTANHTSTHNITANDDASPAETNAVTGWHALNGLPIGVLKGLSPGTDVEVCITEVLEQTHDLAVADRVAWVLSERSGVSHLVLTSTDGYLVCAITPILDWAAAMRMQAYDYAPRIVSVANSEGVLPVLFAVAS